MKFWASGLLQVTSAASQFRVPSPTLSSVARSVSPTKGQRHTRLSRYQNVRDKTFHCKDDLKKN